jgi:hypothetical protein
LFGDRCADEACLLVGEHVDWLATAIVTDLAVVLAVIVTVTLWRRESGRDVAMASLTERASWLVAVVSGVGAATAAAGAALILSRPGLPPVETAVPTAPAVVVVLGLVAAGGGVVWLRLARRPLWGRVVGGVVLAGLAAAIAVPTLTPADPSWSFQVLGVPVPPTTFPQFALAVAVVLPTAVLLRRMITGLTNAEVRRGIGVLWDVGTFWPRWFHPLAPPTYSDRAVTALVRRIEAAGTSGHRPLLVAAHSQGSVIAGTAVLGASRDADLRQVALLTFGSPWHRLYAEFFPAYFHDPATGALQARLPGRWRNLYRPTDPIGGGVGHAEVDVPLLSDPFGRGHSGYWLEDAYDQEVAALARRLAGARTSRAGARSDSTSGA